MKDTLFTEIKPYIGSDPNHWEIEKEPPLEHIIYEYYYQHFSKEESEQFSKQYIEQWLKLESELNKNK